MGGRFLGALALIAWVGLTGACGGQSLDTPEDLVIRDYPKDAPFVLTVVMKSCSDRCATYDASRCKVAVEGNQIKLDVSVHFSRDNSKPCSEVCGPQVIAHCDVGALNPGTYTVVSGSFRKDITIR